MKSLTNEASSNLVIGNISTISKIKKVNSKSKNKNLSNNSKDYKNNGNSNIKPNNIDSSRVTETKNNLNVKNIIFNETSGNVMPRVFKNQEVRSQMKSPYLSTMNDVKYKNHNNIAVNHNKNKSLKKNNGENSNGIKTNYINTLGNEAFTNNYNFMRMNKNTNTNTNINSTEHILQGNSNNKDNRKFGSKIKEFYQNNSKMED